MLMGSPFWWLTAIHMLTFQHGSRLITGQFISSPPNSSVIGVIGRVVVLPCRVANNIPEAFFVRWIFHERAQKRTVSRYDGKNEKEKPDESYQGRAEFFPREFRAGNMSLRLRDVRSSDKGLYTCEVSFNDTYHDVFVELQVAATGGVPSILLRSHVKQGIGLTCCVAGWFPKPKVVWLDGQGQIREELSTTKTTTTSAGLYNVVTSMTLKPGSDMEVSCRVVNDLLNTTSESRVLISGIFFPSISKWLIIFLVILCLNMVLISTVFFKLRSKHKKTDQSVKAKMELEEEKHRLRSLLGFMEGSRKVHQVTSDLRFRSSQDSVNFISFILSAEFSDGEKTKRRAAKSNLKKRFGQLKAELGFWEARSHAVPVRPDPDGRVLELRVPAAPGAESEASDPAGTCAGSTVPVLVGKEGFAAGKHYWEVAVGDGQDWVLGVLGDAGGQGEEGAPCGEGEGCWALHSSRGQVYSSGGGSGSERLQRGAAVVGVLLDLEGGQVNFYDVEQTAVMVPAPLRLGKGRAGRFYPFLSRREGTDTPRILPVSTPPPLKLL
ncbi:butyrophilin subfamily 2 member A1-like [Falco rusticolus]|uniref:butyrophilin subfamily 2 member A1-like n=1 Tax=Falco rusticolus TaxID=120794 RepID=UPI0018866E20|nr:butyrophilin subfamily 2 member A1-like [Falco rusticolus]